MAERDEAWFEGIFRTHHVAVLAYATRRCDDPDEALAETFAVAWRHRDRLPEPALPWLYRTAANVIANQSRGRVRRARLFLRLANDPAWEPSADAAGHELRTARDHRDIDRVHQVMATLSATDQEVLRLAAWEELDSAGIAAVLGCSPGAAKARLHRARHKFRTAWTLSGPAVPGAAIGTSDAFEVEGAQA